MLEYLVVGQGPDAGRRPDALRHAALARQPLRQRLVPPPGGRVRRAVRRAVRVARPVLHAAERARGDGRLTAGATAAGPRTSRATTATSRSCSSLVEGMNRTAEALRAARPDTVLVHVEDVGPGARRLGPTWPRRRPLAQERRLLPLDLACGRVDPGAPPVRLAPGARGDRGRTARRWPRRRRDWDVLGVNFYPWSNRRLVRRRNGQLGVGRRLRRRRPWPTSCGWSTTATASP